MSDLQLLFLINVVYLHEDINEKNIEILLNNGNLDYLVLHGKL